MSKVPAMEVQEWISVDTLQGNLPSVYLGIFLPDLIGRRQLQFWSTIIAAILYAVWAGVSETASPGGLITLFTLSQFALGAGPNVTTFLFPVELFPTRVRGTAHGISAASGKIGAVLTSFAFGTLVQNLGLRGALGLFSGLMALVALLTLLIPETKGKSLEDIEADVLYGTKIEWQDSDERPQNLDVVDKKTVDVGVAAVDSV
jgi:PHS family inorganic phosphate transporter-like MFS transporter